MGATLALLVLLSPRGLSTGATLALPVWCRRSSLLVLAAAAAGVWDDVTGLRVGEATALEPAPYQNVGAWTSSGLCSARSDNGLGH